MKYTIKETDNIQLIKILDLNNLLVDESLTEEVTQHIQQGNTEFIIDLAALEYIVSAGLSLLISILTRARSAGGDVVILNISDKLQRIFLITRLHSTFTVKETLEDAIEHFAKANVR
ncbi:MAG: STAS domain-containing protein [Saprospiraceae bacterium]|nr:STAS domain-containing protein [Saprospiraceae bacterium]